MKLERWTVWASLVLAACSGATNPDPCPGGICTGGADGSVDADAGVRDPDADLAASGGCVEAWTCTAWATMAGTSTRTCTDANACGTAAARPLETATLPALDLDYFKCKVQPILSASCAFLGCHGTETGRAWRTYARGRHRDPSPTATIVAACPPTAGASHPLSDCEGSIECECAGRLTANEWSMSFDNARALALDGNGAPWPAGMEASSDLVAQPVVGGKAHAGVHLFQSTDPDYVTLKAWLGGAKLGSTCTPAFD